MITTLKILIASLIAVAAAEMAKRSTVLGALIVALPLTSMVSMGFLYYDTKNAAKVAEYTRTIPPLVLPTLVFFYAFAFFVDKQLGFAMAMVLATAIMLVCYTLVGYFFARNGM